MKMKLFAIVALSLTSALSFADDKPKDEMDAKKQEMMKAWTNYSTPGEPHKVFANMVGKWTYTSKWWETPEAKPQESKGKSTIKLILGGRFLEHKTTGKAMGMPFEGLGLTGYNNITKKYESLWLDNMGTGMMHGTGSYDVESKTLKDSGEYSCPMSGDKKREYRSEWKVVDKNNLVYSMWGPGLDDDKEFKQMEMNFKRAK